jgi:hypothetical protein
MNRSNLVVVIVKKYGAISIIDTYTVALVMVVVQGGREVTVHTDQYGPNTAVVALSWWSLIKPFPRGTQPSLGTRFVPPCAVSRAPHTLATKRSLDRVTALCQPLGKNTTKFCGCGKSRVHYLAHCCQPTVLHCTACCAVLCKLILSLRCVLSGCTVTSRATLYKPSNICTHCHCTNTVLPHITTLHRVVKQILPTSHFKTQYPTIYLFFTLKRNFKKFAP